MIGNYFQTIYKVLHMEKIVCKKGYQLFVGGLFAKIFLFAMALREMHFPYL